VDIMVVGLIEARYVDIARFNGQTTEGKLTPIAHWRRYAVLMLVISAGLWALARVAWSHNRL
jgi:hypothetical protein